MRTIEKILTRPPKIDEKGLFLRRLLPHEARVSGGPFVFFDHYRNDGTRGVGDTPHSHAGIEVISYLLEGRAQHHDSLGNSDILSSGDGQVICAGRGIVHAERPLAATHGLQLWSSLAPERKFIDPTYAAVRANDIPVVRLAGATVYVMAGQVAGVTGPMKLYGDATFGRVSILANSEATVEVRFEPQLAIYALTGKTYIQETTLDAGMMGLLSDGKTLHIKNESDDVAELALFGGDPVRGDILFSAPFVMDTVERLQSARRAFTAGLNGRLDGVLF